MRLNINATLVTAYRNVQWP